MSEKDENPQVEVVCLRGTFVKGFGDVKRGDVFTVPANDKENGVPPLRWWLFTKKVCLPEDAEVRIKAAESADRAMLKAVGN